MTDSKQKCDRCGINWSILGNNGIVKICVICSETYRCKICDILLYPDIYHSTCDECWPKLGISKITETVYLSDYEQSQRYDELKRLGIKQILSIGKELIPHNTKDFRTLHIKIDDHPDENIKQHFADADCFIKQGSTLVHCYAGISRSASLVIAHLMKSYNMRFREAFEFCRNRRVVVNPNKGFQNQLMTYEKELLDEYEIIFDMDKCDLVTEDGDFIELPSSPS